MSELRVFDANGQVIDWEQTGFPMEAKRMAFRIFPGAVLEEPPKFQFNLDFEMRSDFLISLLTYLYKQVNLRIEYLQTELSNGVKN